VEVSVKVVDGARLENIIAWIVGKRMEMYGCGRH
jgi:hypothetical protein